MSDDDRKRYMGFLQEMTGGVITTTVTPAEFKVALVTHMRVNPIWFEDYFEAMQNDIVDESAKYLREAKAHLNLVNPGKVRQHLLDEYDQQRRTRAAVEKRIETFKESVKQVKQRLVNGGSEGSSPRPPSESLEMMDSDHWVLEQYREYLLEQIRENTRISVRPETDSEDDYRTGDDDDTPQSLLTYDSTWSMSLHRSLSTSSKFSSYSPARMGEMSSKLTIPHHFMICRRSRYGALSHRINSNGSVSENSSKRL